MSTEGMLMCNFGKLYFYLLNEYFYFIEIVNVSISEDDECSSSACHTEIAQLQKEIYDSEKRIRDAKTKYHELLVLNLKKDIRINQLNKHMADYNPFRGTISDKTIDILSSIDNSKSKDSVFVLTVVKNLYEKELPKLKERTFSGQKRTTAKTSKEPITPEKKNVLENLFRQRISNEPDNESRMKDFAKYVKQAIDNINKTNK